MNAGGWTALGILFTALASIVVAMITGRAARRTGETNAAAGAWSQVLPIWQGTIEQLRQSSAQQATQIKELQESDTKKTVQIEELQAKDRVNVAWKQAALTHLVALHTYIRVHLHRDDIPTVPAELAADIPPFPPAV